MQIKNDVTLQESGSALSVNSGNGDNSDRAPIQEKPKASRPVLKKRDQSNVQRIEIDRDRHEAAAGDLLQDTRNVRQGVEALLEYESQLTAHAIADAPYRLQELINEKIAAYGYDYADLKAGNDRLRKMWGIEKDA